MQFADDNVWNSWRAILLQLPCSAAPTVILMFSCFVCFGHQSMICGYLPLLAGDSAFIRAAPINYIIHLITYASVSSMLAACKKSYQALMLLTQHLCAPRMVPIIFRLLIRFRGPASLVQMGQPLCDSYPNRNHSDAELYCYYASNAALLTSRNV